MKRRYTITQLKQLVSEYENDFTYGFTNNFITWLKVRERTDAVIKKSLWACRNFEIFN